MDDALAYASLGEISDRIGRREVSPVELTSMLLERISALEPRLNAFITVLPDMALAEARRAEAEITRGDRRGLLHGVPYSLKDLIETRGIRTTAGSLVLADHVPNADATVVERLAAAGAVLLGKTNLHEFAYGIPHPDYGLVPNPWDLGYSASGSSSGSAVSVAAGIGYGSIGTDTGGSIRIPASWCNLVGLKPTYGRVSLAGVIPLGASLDHVGPLTRTVRDAAILLGTMAGHDPRDPASADVPVPDYVAALDDAAPLRVGVAFDALEEGVDPAIAAAIRTAAEAFAGLGAAVLPVTLPDPDRASAAVTTTMQVEAAAYHREWLQRDPEQYSPAVRARLERGLAVLGVDYVAAQQARREIRAAYLALLEAVDVVVTPTTVVNPITLDELRREMTPGPADPMNRRTRFSGPINLVGLPAASVPCGFTDGGLPIGMQLIGRPFDEATVLRAASRYERETGWSRRHPTL